MADEQDGWLDRETAEILLRGESLKAVDPAVRDRAERLAETLDALAAYPAPTSGELPGEAAALAAFRKARADDAAEWAARRPPSVTEPRRGRPMPGWSASARTATVPGAPAGAVRCASGWPPR